MKGKTGTFMEKIEAMGFGVNITAQQFKLLYFILSVHCWFLFKYHPLGIEYR